MQETLNGPIPFGHLLELIYTALETSGTYHQCPPFRILYSNAHDYGLVSLRKPMNESTAVRIETASSQGDVVLCGDGLKNWEVDLDTLTKQFHLRYACDLTRDDTKQIHEIVARILILQKGGLTC